MDNNKFLVDVVNTSSDVVVVEIANSALDTEGFNRLELIISADLDMSIDVDISDNNIKLTDNRTLDTGENTKDIVYNLLIQKETPFAQLKLLIDGAPRSVIIKNI